MNQIFCGINLCTIAQNYTNMSNKESFYEQYEIESIINILLLNHMCCIEFIYGSERMISSSLNHYSINNKVDSKLYKKKS